MEEKQIIKLLFERDEKAIAQMSAQYSDLCRAIAFNILENSEDSEEALNDTWLRVWNTIPPQKPESLRAYIAAIVRNISIDIYRKRLSFKRKSDRMSIALEEVSELLTSDISTEKLVESKEILSVINSFLASLPKKKRIIFVRRYFYFDSIGEIAKRLRESESYITVNLTRMRKSLAKLLEKEGVL